MPSAKAPRLLKGESLREKIRTCRGYFAKNLLHQKQWHKQEEIEYQIMEGEHKATEISGCVGSGKTLGIAIVALEWLCAYRPSRVFSLAPSFRQVDANLWGYMKQLWAQAAANGTPLGDEGDILHVPKIQFKDPRTGKPIPGWYYEGFSTDEPHNVHGLHGPNDLVIIDDAHGIKRELADELENIRAGGNTRLVLAYNKMVLAGPTYDATHIEAKHFNHVGISYADLVEARRRGMVLPGALGEETVQRWKGKYGANSSFVRVKVLNLHPNQEKDTLIPLDWIEAAFIRGEKGETPFKGELVVGGDVGAQGDDASALAPMRGRMVGPIEEWHEPDLMVTTGRFVAPMKQEESHVAGRAATSKAFAFVDSIGIGAGVVSRMAEITNRVAGHPRSCRGCDEPLKVEPVCGADDAEGTVLDAGVMKPAKEVFKNKRAQVWWNLRECLNPANAELIGLTRDDDLSAQLSCIKWRTASDSRIEIEPKLGTGPNWGIKSRLGFSPNKADAVSYAAWGSKRSVHGEYEAASDGEHEQRQIKVDGGKYQTAEAVEPGVFGGGVEDVEV